MTSIIENVVKNFSNNIGNGINLGVYYKSIVDHVIKTGDTTPLVKAVNASINRGDTALTSQLRVTTGKIWNGAKIKSSVYEG